VVLLLRDDAQGSRHQATLAWVLRTPGNLLGLPDAVRQLDQQVVDCAAATRTLWRSEAYRAQDADTNPAKTLAVPPESRRPEFWADLGGNQALMAAALRTLCAGGGNVVKPLAAAPAPASSPGTTTPAGAPAGPMATAGVPTPAASSPATPAGQTPTGGKPTPPGGNPSPVQAGVPVAPTPTPTGAMDQPVFADSAFSLRALARLTDATYANTSRRDAEAAALRVLVGVIHQLNQRSEAGYQPYQKDHLSFKLTVVQMAVEESRRKLAQFQKQIDDRQALLTELELVPQALPPVPRKAPDSFKAELFRHTPTGQYLLAFRGTDEAADWISNAWLGVDLMKFTSPHYAAADDLVAALVRKGIQPMVLGHSLGGGMAQYTAYRHNLRVVGFNASPVPERYLSGSRYDASRARLYTALELPQRQPDPSSNVDGRVGDPLSLQVDKLRKLSPTLHGWIKASHQLVKPICLLTLPDPYYDAFEDADMAEAVTMGFAQGPLQTLIHLTPKDAAKKAALIVATNQGIDFLLDDPAWAQVGGTDQVATVEAQKRAVKSGVKQAKALAAMGKLLGTLFNTARGAHMGRTAVDVTAGLVDMFAIAEIKRMLQVHGMARFVRGLGATGDLSAYDVRPDGNTPCARVESTL